MAIVHTFVSLKSDGGDDTLVRPSDWNANHSLTGLSRHFLTTVGTTGYTVYHNLNSTFSCLVGWSTTWNSWLYVSNIGLTNMDLVFTNPTESTSDVLVTNIEIIP